MSTKPRVGLTKGDIDRLVALLGQQVNKCEFLHGYHQSRGNDRDAARNYRSVERDCRIIVKLSCMTAMKKGAK
jgi:hypothetical protein